MFFQGFPNVLVKTIMDGIFFVSNFMFKFNISILNKSDTYNPI